MVEGLIHRCSVTNATIIFTSKSSEDLCFIPHRIPVLVSNYQVSSTSVSECVTQSGGGIFL